MHDVGVLDSCYWLVPFTVANVILLPVRSLTSYTTTFIPSIGIKTEHPLEQTFPPRATTSHTIMSDLPLLPNGLAPPSARRRLVPGQQAIETLMLELNLSVPNERQLAAFARIQEAYAASQAHLNPEFFTPVIVDLDTVLFNGWLSDYMLISWESITGTPCCLSGEPSKESPYEIDRSGNSRLRVRFAVYPSGPREQTWGVILHEMLHAYLDLMSEWRGLKQPHGPLFGPACTAMVRRLALGGLKVHDLDQGAGLTA